MCHLVPSYAYKQLSVSNLISQATGLSLVPQIFTAQLTTKLAPATGVYVQIKTPFFVQITADPSLAVPLNVPSFRTNDLSPHFADTHIAKPFFHISLPCHQSTTPASDVLLAPHNTTHHS
jgi:hypothetical protein